jgi:hypothetical protein
MFLPRRSIFLVGATLAALLLNASLSQAAAQSPTAYNWLQFDGDAMHDGLNYLETTIGAANVANLKLLFKVKLSDTADGAPAYLSGVKRANSKSADMIFVTERNGTLAALDAHSGAPIWSDANPANGCQINNSGNTCYTTSSPAIQPDGQFVYSYGLDGFVHKYAVADGAEVTTGGWPELTSTKPTHEKGSSALSIVTDKAGGVYLYVAHAGYPGDQGDYQGHLTVINLGTGAQKVFNAACSDQAVHFMDNPANPDCPSVQTAIWARPGAIYDPDTNKTYITTGNGTFSPKDHDWGDSILAINPDGSGVGGDPLDSYTPTEYLRLDITDADLGSAEPVLLPTTIPNSPFKHLAIQAGKDQKLRLVNLDNLNGSGKAGAVGGELAVFDLPQGGQVLTAPVAILDKSSNDVIIFVGNSKGLSANILRFDSQGKATLTTGWLVTDPTTSPLIANGVLFAVGDHNLRAIDELSGATLWQDTSIGGIHWESPIVANGVLYVTDNSATLRAYSLP